MIKTLYDVLTKVGVVLQIAQKDYGFGKTKNKTLTKATYDAIGDHFRELWGKEAGWAHSVCASMLLSVCVFPDGHRFFLLPTCVLSPRSKAKVLTNRQSRRSRQLRRSRTKLARPRLNKKPIQFGLRKRR